MLKFFLNTIHSSMSIALNLFFKTILSASVIFGLVLLFRDHAQHVKGMAMEMNAPVVYRAPVKQSLICDGVVVANGAISYEDGTRKARSASNSNGIWRVDRGVYRQKEGELCHLK